MNGTHSQRKNGPAAFFAVLSVAMLALGFFCNESIGSEFMGVQNLPARTCNVPVEIPGQGVLCLPDRGLKQQQPWLPFERSRLFWIPLDINRATESTLCSLPGVGASLARRIILSRPYRRWTDLLQVSGMGTTLLERIKPFARIGPAPSVSP